MRILKASTQCDVSADILHYYEKIDLLPPINRNNGGTRDSGEIDLRRVEFSKFTRSTGLSIEILLE